MRRSRLSNFCSNAKGRNLVDELSYVFWDFIWIHVSGDLFRSYFKGRFDRTVPAARQLFAARVEDCGGNVA